ncbi:MAG: cyclic nucleotide-binding domain-containing protein [Pseudobdellovibrio sp.]
MKIATDVSLTDIQNEISKFHFFQKFPSDKLNTFSKMITVLDYRAGETILEQGQTNEALYFLRRGELKILVDGELVSLMSSPGEVLGEMSLINKSNALATVKAVSDVSMFFVQESNFKGMTSENQESFQNLMNQVLTQILVSRLFKTNEKAKKFELTNRELEKSQQNLLKVNQELESEIARRSHELVEKVRNLTETHLSIAAQQMNLALQDNSTSINSQKVRDWSTSIGEVVDLLKPMIDLSQETGKNKFRRVYLCDGNKKQQGIAKLALGGTGVELGVYSTAEELTQALELTPADLILIDADMSVLILTLKLRWPQIPIVLMLGQDISAYFELLNRFPQQPYFVSRNPENRSLTIKSLTTTVAKILNKDFFGFEKYLSWGAHVVESKIKFSTQRMDEIEKMKDHFKSFGVRSTFLDQAHTVAEEMLMNAIYDAPMDQDGKPKYNHLSRNDEIELSDDQAACLRYGTDGVLLAISVTDPFGSLTKNILQSYLEKNYNGEETGTADKGGAGKGLHMIISNSDFVVFNVKPQKKTEVICFLQLERSKEEDPKPTFHLFFQP